MVVIVLLILSILHVTCVRASWPFGDTVNVNFDTKYDNNHNELKQLIAAQKKFDSSNWTHYAHLFQIGAGGFGIFILIIYLYSRCRRRQPHVRSINYSHPYVPENISPPYASALGHAINQYLPPHRPALPPLQHAICSPIVS